AAVDPAAAPIVAAAVFWGGGSWDRRQLRRARLAVVVGLAGVAPTAAWPWSPWRRRSTCFWRRWIVLF
ncbi:hypothetical protein, partial [Dactylosporangium siamense]|uniref:hypothetical protein n=1 Tax=Dactylosporangium siamense TaxID=685454 RepID=UPI0019413DFB